jgi:tetraacyldisaccharide 4'-kinase
MNFNNYLLRSIRIFLFPFALLYGLIVWIRNLLYDKNIIRSGSFNLPIICVGNLSVGGTGKSPMVEYLLDLLSRDFKVATVSRGYKRKSRGYHLANDNSSALDIGDEPMQFHIKFPEVAVAVGEERIVAIPQLLFDRPATEVIILDDAFQHRSVIAGLNILLTEYNNLYTRDFFLPTGDLRDLRSSSRRAKIIVVTKCPESLTEQDKRAVVKELNPEEGQEVFFTTIKYGDVFHLTQGNTGSIDGQTEVLLITGIANPVPLKKELEARTIFYDFFQFADHHIFTIDDLTEIKSRFDKMSGKGKMIVTTEKDAVRLMKFRSLLEDVPIYVIPIKHEFLFGESEKFNRKVIEYIRDYKKNNTN